MTDTPTITPGTRLGPYEVSGLLGSGGMGEVYRARDPRLGRDVAVKVLREAGLSDPVRLQRFEDEARAAGALGHPNLLVVYDVGRHGEMPYLVSELLEGQTLGAYLAEAGPVPARKALEWATQMAQGLAAAHDKGIVHRDLKPRNLFLMRDGRLKILDFGLAKLVSAAGTDEATATVAQRTEPGVVLGTVGYMSPEQVRGLPVDQRADIFALGIVLHEMLSGAQPFARDTTAETMTAILREEAPALPPAVPPALDRIVRRCLEKRPEDRFRSAHDLGLALEALSGGSGSVSDLPSAPPASPARRLSRRQLLAAGGGSLALAGLGFGAGTYLARQSRPAVLPSYQRLTFRRGMIRTARFGPDHQTIYYGALWDGDACRVFSARPESPESAPLQNLPPAAPLAISSSGELALLLGSLHRGVMPYGTLARVSLTGGAPRELAEGVKYADWSPDGRDLAAVRLVDGRERLEYPLGNVIAEPVAGGGFSFPRVSRDGSRVACFELTEPSSLVGAVALVNRDGDKRVISPRYFNCFGLAWNGDEIWFTAAGERPLFRDAIHALSSDGAVRQVARLPGNASLHDVAPDGRALMARTDDRSGIAVLAPGDDIERDLAWFDSPVPAAMSDDGSAILFSESGVGGGPAGSVYIRATSGAPAVRLGDGGARALSPDGRWALAAAPFNQAAVYMDLLPVGAGQARRIEHTGVLFSTVRWLPDGNRVVVHAREEGHEPRLYVLDLDGGAMRPITPEGAGASWALAPEGRRVAVATASGVALHAVDGDTAAPQFVPGMSGREVFANWIVGGLLVSADPNPFALGRILLIDPVTGSRQLWKEIQPRDVGGIMNVTYLRVTPDGRFYTYFWHRALSDLYLVNQLGS